MVEKASIFISCGIFEEELRYLIREKKLDWDVTFIEAALHVDFDMLREKLVETLEKHKDSGAELKVLYGHCHPDIMDILERYGAKKLRAGNCLEAMVGPEKIAELNREGTAFFLSVGWVNHWERMFTLGEKELDFDFRSMFENYRRVIVFDTGVIPIDEGKVEAFAAFTNLPVERMRINLDYLERLIREI